MLNNKRKAVYELQEPLDSGTGIKITMIKTGMRHLG